MVESHTLQIPLPPIRYRYLIGLLEESRFENPTGELILPDVPVENYDSVFDFGCGCGRLARLLLLQRHRPKYYLGIDINTKMIEWCTNNLTSVDNNFTFVHHDVFNPLLGQFNTKRPYAPFPCEDETFSLFLAYSVFTHLLPEQTEFYLAEMSRILKPGGIAYISWFFCDKQNFPMMQDFQNALYINVEDPTNAVIYDRTYFEVLLKANGLRVIKEENNFQTNLYLMKEKTSDNAVRDIPNIYLNQFQERPSIPRSMDNQTSSEASFVLPKINSATNPELLDARIISKDRNLIEEELFIEEMTPVVFDLENSGEAAWLTSEKYEDVDGLFPQAQVKIQASWQHMEPATGEAGAELNLPTMYGKVFLKLPQVTPVLSGQSLRVPLLLYTPTQPGNYIFNLNMALGDKEWPGEPLYTQKVQVLNAPENTDAWKNRGKELEKIQLYNKIALLEHELSDTQQALTQTQQALTQTQQALTQTQQSFKQAQQAFTEAQQEVIELKASYKELESWASVIENNYNQIPSLIRKASGLIKKRK